MKKLIALILLALMFQTNSFAESDSLTVNSDVASNPQFSTGTFSVTTDYATPDYGQEDVILGYGSKHTLTFKKDGRVLNQYGKEIENDKDLIKQFRNVLNGICSN